VDVFQEMYGVEPEELSDFAIDCCQGLIEEVYGEQSLEMQRFNREICL
ncbi:MAG: YkgJ family cysteine cluster protein, partial [Symploca sp. SIO1B1]|nr:YkgJ family cysteine cluster protein [Symploca sp. SIO1B1]